MAAETRGRDEQDTKERLLAVAGPMFADRGYEAVSTRDLARKAEVNLSAITYHFGGKRGLYEAAIERVLDDMAPIRSLVMNLVDSGMADVERDAGALPDLVQRFVRMMVTFLTHPDFQVWRMQLMLREITQPSDAFAVVMARHITPLQNSVARMVASATDRPATDPHTIILSHAVISQLLHFGIARNVLLTRLDWPAYTPERVEEIIAITTDIIFAMLGLDKRRET
jgi:AcrR family transcriptional regulator